MSEGAEYERLKRPPDEPPPKYLGQLIGSINDGAKAAQTSALFLAFLGLYLSAIAISVSDEDLLNATAIQLSQLGGVSIPVIVSFLLGPILFLLLHASLMMRYGMLVTGLRRFCDDLRKMVPDKADQIRCRNLLANVDFVLMIAGQDDPCSRGQTWLYKLSLFIFIAAIPVAVLLAVQISFLRYQSETITWVQRGVLLVDLAMLVVFYDRLWWAQRPQDRKRYDHIFRAASYSVLPLIILIINLLYFGVPDAAARTVRYYDWLKYDKLRQEVRWWQWQRLATQPLDLVVCPNTKWGCRYLDLSNRTLVGKPEGGAIQELRTHPEDINEALPKIDGLSARNRTLRFANFNQSRAYAIDLLGSDLRQATFWSASLQGAKFSNANLQGANFERAQLQQADFNWADLRGASLASTQLQSAMMMGVDLQGADLTMAQLQGADLLAARLQGSNLTSANLTATDLRDVHLSRFTFDKTTSFNLADMRRLEDVQISLDNQQIIVSAIDPKRLDEFYERLDRAQEPISADNIKNTVLALKADASTHLFSKLPEKCLTLWENGTEKQKECHSFARKLACYATQERTALPGVARRATAVVLKSKNEDRNVYVDLACCLASPQGSTGATPMDKLFSGQIAQLKASCNASCKPAVYADSNNCQD